MVVVCNQTGKMIHTSTSSLSKENGETLTEKDLATGTQLLFNSDGKTILSQLSITVKRVKISTCTSSCSMLLHFYLANKKRPTASATEQVKKSKLTQAKDDVNYG